MWLNNARGGTAIRPSAVAIAATACVVIATRAIRCVRRRHMAALHKPIWDNWNVLPAADHVERVPHRH